jgi:predicted amino acid racemase
MEIIRTGCQSSGCGHVWDEGENFRRILTLKGKVERNWGFSVVGVGGGSTQVLHTLGMYSLPTA